MRRDIEDPLLGEVKGTADIQGLPGTPDTESLRTHIESPAEG